jgi:HK97 family phage portal protein
MLQGLRSLLFKKTTVNSVAQYKQDKINFYNQGGTRFDFTQPELCSSVFAAVSVIAGSISKLPLVVYKQTDKGRVPYTDHPWYNSLRYNPDLRLSTSKWLNFAITTTYLTGNAFFLKKEFDEYLNISNKQLQHLGQPDKVIFHENEYWYKFDTVDTWIPSRDLIHFYIISKDGGVTGLNPIASIRSELEIQHGAESVTANFYKNNATTMLFLEADLEGVGNSTKEKAQEYLDRFYEDQAGYINSGKIIRVPPMYKLKNLPLADLKFMENSKYTISQIAAIFQVPGFYLGVQDTASSYGKAEQQQIAFKNTCLSNVANIIKSELEAKILTVEERNSGVSIEFDYSNLYDIDHESKANYYKTLASIGGVTVNQIAEAFNLPKVESPFADFHFIQSQNQAIEHYDKWSNNTIQPPAPNNNTNQ